MTPSPSTTRPPLPEGVRPIGEVPGFGPDAADPAAGRGEPTGASPWSVVHPEWAEAFSWLVQGNTTRGRPDAPYDLALLGGSPALEVTERWLDLPERLGMVRVVHGRQIHGAVVRVAGSGGPGLHLGPATDGWVTRVPGVLLTVSTADCVPVHLVCPEPGGRAVGLLHAGWRGVAAGILERGLDVFARRLACHPADLHIHLGPSICGACYEVGPEVHEALGLEPPPGPGPIDLRSLLAARAVERGVPPGAVSVSEHCTRCGDSPFFSHRRGDAGRQVAFLGIRPA